LINPSNLLILLYISRSRASPVSPVILQWQHCPKGPNFCRESKAMAKRLIPTLNRVLVEKIVPPSKTNAGILLPEKSSKLNSGKVIAVGPGARDKEGNTIPVAFKEGDTVLLPNYGGDHVKLGEKDYHLYRDEEILGTLHD
ncbi:hypothetical protein CICLE_v10018326mg, partial [Citrus x clementina]